MKEAMVIIFTVPGSAKKTVEMRKYTTTHRRQQQHKMMKNNPTQVGQKETDKGTRRKLNVENETDNDDDTRENEADVQVFFSFHFTIINPDEILYFKLLFIKILVHAFCQNSKICLYVDSIWLTSLNLSSMMSNNANLLAILTTIGFNEV